MITPDEKEQIKKEILEELQHRPAKSPWGTVRQHILVGIGVSVEVNKYRRGEKWTPELSYLYQSICCIVRQALQLDDTVKRLPADRVDEALQVVDIIISTLDQVARRAILKLVTYPKPPCFNPEPNPLCIGTPNSPGCDSCNLYAHMKGEGGLD
jgi:hypothetical protein